MFLPSVLGIVVFLLYTASPLWHSSPVDSAVTVGSLIPESKYGDIEFPTNDTSLEPVGALYSSIYHALGRHIGLDDVKLKHHVNLTHLFTDFKLEMALTNNLIGRVYLYRGQPEGFLSLHFGNDSSLAKVESS